MGMMTREPFQGEQLTNVNTLGNQPPSGSLFKQV